MSKPEQLSGDENLNPDANVQKSRERNTFLFLTIFLAPILSIIIVGSYGFIIWMSQIIYGPPGGH
ncbi:periplasmic nitrate reductase, NapE protein [Thalassotalea litorea]|uniref:Periplasmic nitrate reductase, NapE protein n=1 Tax=Thalassotalea litorea TaxID=2020715 RepID=A0A5R9INK8_9GAMM|nr:periplasmic nitrate reductase, NapE protein [Thalassotalea litorea]TLU66862.1 periplasmic nitrate reductase, NapE protein [Thalassotalea litorea]